MQNNDLRFGCEFEFYVNLDREGELIEKLKKDVFYCLVLLALVFIFFIKVILTSEPVVLSTSRLPQMLVRRLVLTTLDSQQRPLTVQLRFNP